MTLTAILITIYLLSAVTTATIIYTKVFKKDFSGVGTRDIHTSLVFILVPIVNITPIILVIWSAFTKSSK
jgi:hypothetical protein